jgi:hypothetical protein
MITLYCIGEDKLKFTTSDNFHVVTINNISSSAELVQLLNSAATPFVAIADPIVSFDKSVVLDAVTLLRRSQHAKALTAGSKDYAVGRVTRQLIVDAPVNGLVVYKRESVQFVDKQQTDPYDWLTSFKLRAPNTLIVSPLFYKRVTLLTSDQAEEEEQEQPLPAPPPKEYVVSDDPNLPSAANTVFVSVAAYSDPYTKANRFVRSARKFNVPLRFIVWKEAWHGFVYHKFHQLLKSIQQWRKEGFKYAFVLDSFDVVFTDPPEVCCAKAAQYIPANKLAFNREYPDRTFPFNEVWFRTMVETEGCHLNAGAVFGSFDMFETVIPLALEIQKEMLELNTRVGVLTRLIQEDVIRKDLKRYVNDDQLLYQLTSLYFPHHFMTDTERRLMVWISDIKDQTLSDLRQLHYSNKMSVNEASIIHSSGSARRMDWTAWCQKEGLLVD